MEKNKYHEPVLVKEIIKVIKDNNLGSKNLKIIDATLGTAGHTEAFLQNDWEVLGIEADESMLNLARKRLHDSNKVHFANGNFRNIDQISKVNDFKEIDVILFDLGVSNLQLMSTDRGFSFSNPDTSLDMRIDPKNQTVKATDLLNILRQDQLEQIFEKVIDRNLSKMISREIVSFRSNKRIEKVDDLNNICEILPAKKGLNKATLAYLALRIAVNSEFENLSEALPKAFEILKKGGILLVISFHSGEDRIVKDYFKSLSDKGLAKVFELIKPGIEEINRNPKSRSSKLRFIKKI